jgi:hypothetical protein
MCSAGGMVAGRRFRVTARRCGNRRNLCRGDRFREGRRLIGRRFPPSNKRRRRAEGDAPDAVVRLSGQRRRGGCQVGAAASAITPAGEVASPAACALGGSGRIEALEVGGHTRDLTSYCAHEYVAT